MHDVADILASKGSEVHAIKPDATVYEAIEKMVAKNVGSLLVRDDAGTPCGIITERHYVERVALRGRASQTTRVDEIMSAEIVCVTPRCPVDDCMELMTEHRVRQIAVMHNGHLAGIVSIGDVVKFLARAHRDQVQYLTDYIEGRTTSPISPAIGVTRH